jgi:hypothetical protein
MWSFVFLFLTDLHLQVSSGSCLGEGVQHLQQEHSPVDLHQEQDEKEQRVKSGVNVEMLKTFRVEHCRVD